MNKAAANSEQYNLFWDTLDQMMDLVKNIDKNKFLTAKRLSEDLQKLPVRFQLSQLLPLTNLRATRKLKDYKDTEEFYRYLNTGVIIQLVEHMKNCYDIDNFVANMKFLQKKVPGNDDLEIARGLKIVLDKFPKESKTYIYAATILFMISLSFTKQIVDKNDLELFLENPEAMTKDLIYDKKFWNCVKTILLSNEALEVYNGIFNSSKNKKYTIEQTQKEIGEIIENLDKENKLFSFKSDTCVESSFATFNRTIGVNENIVNIRERDKNSWLIFMVIIIGHQLARGKKIQSERASTENPEKSECESGVFWKNRLFGGEPDFGKILKDASLANKLAHYLEMGDATNFIKMIKECVTLTNSSEKSRFTIKVAINQYTRDERFRRAFKPVGCITSLDAKAKTDSKKTEL